MMDGYAHLAAAIIERAVADLQDQRHRDDAVTWIESPELDQHLVDAGCDLTAAACRLALRRRGLLPELPRSACEEEAARHEQRLCPCSGKCPTT